MGQYEGDILISLKVSDSGGSSLYRWRVRYETNGSWGSWSSYQTSTSYNETLTTEGNRRVQVEAYDNAGNKTTYTSGYYRIDKTKPSATINPNSSSWTNSNINFTVTLSDSGGSRLKQWRIRYSSDDGATYGSWSSWNTTTSYSQYLDVEGRRKIQVEVHDNAGNTNIITSGSYLIDKKAPTHVSGSISGYRYKDGSSNYWIRPGDTISVIMEGLGCLIRNFEALYKIFRDKSNHWRY